MELKDYMTILNRRKWLILAVVVVAMVTVLIGSKLQTPIYQSSVTLRVAASSTGQLDYSSASYVSQLLNTTAQIATTGSVLIELQSRLNLPKLPAVTSEVIPNTELIKLTVEDTDPQRAADTAAMLADTIISQSYYVYTGGSVNALSVLGTQVAEVEKQVLVTREEYTRSLQLTPAAPATSDLLYQELMLEQRNYDSLLSQYQSQQIQNEIRSNMITIVEKPLVAAEPSKPQIILNMILGLIAGVLGGVVLAFIVNALDATLYTAQEIERYTGLSTFARIPKVSRERTRLMVNSEGAFSDSFRELAMKLIQVDGARPPKVFLVFSAEPNQGKSMIVSHLAVALAECGKKTIAVDCDMRLPRLHKWFSVPNTLGLKDVLEEEAELNTAILETEFEGLWVLTSGECVTKPTLLLGSQAMKNVVNTLSRKYDFVLLDTPALLAVGDAGVISESADGMIFVARRKETTREAARSAGSFLKSYSDKFSALVVNQDSTSDGYYYHRSEPESRELTSEFLIKRLQVQQSVTSYEKSEASARNRTRELDLEVERTVIAMALEQPLYGQIRVANELKKRGMNITPGVVRNIWLKNGLETFEKRNQALGKKSHGEMEDLSAAQRKAFEKAHADRKAEEEIQSQHPGFLGVQDCIYIGRVDGVGRVYQQVFIDTFTNVAFAKLYYRKNVAAAIDLLNVCVLPFYHEEEIRLQTVLTDQSAIFTGEAGEHDYEKLLNSESIEHRVTDGWHAKTNGISLRFQRMLNDDFYQVMLRQKTYSSLDELQLDLDHWIRDFNKQKEFEGKYCYGRTPYQTLLETKLPFTISETKKTSKTRVETPVTL